MLLMMAAEWKQHNTTHKSQRSELTAIFCYLCKMRKNEKFLLNFAYELFSAH